MKLNQVFPFILIVCGGVGLVASMVLSYDTLKIANDANYTPDCNLNPIISCGKVINAGGDTIFKIPFSFYGIAAFAILIAAAAGMLAGAKYKRWYWLTFQAFVVGGFIAAYGMLLRSIYSINALCPFCLSVDVGVTIIFWYTTLYNIENNVISLGQKTKLKAAFLWARKHHIDLLIVWFLLIIGIILNHFWYFYGKYF